MTGDSNCKSIEMLNVDVALLKAENILNKLNIANKQWISKSLHIKPKPGVFYAFYQNCIDLSKSFLLNIIIYI